MPELGMRIGELALKNPVICGSGEHVASEEGLNAAIDAGAAAVVAKSANESDAARRQWDARAHVVLGDDWQPLADDAAGSGSYFNRSGLVPLEWDEWLQVLERADAHARTRNAYVVASLIPGDLEELPRLARDVQAAGLRWLELNLSAPHAGESEPGAVERAEAPRAVRDATGAVRAAVTIPITVKLTGESGDVVAMAAAASAAGADSVAMIGRHMAFLPDPDTRRPVLGTFGAISGPWALPLALRWVAKTRAQTNGELPLIGSNGARSGRDVARFLLAGASAVQLATSVLAEGFRALSRVLGELEAYLAEQGVDARDLVGEAADAAGTYQEAALEGGA
jgi:dihydroorotate dehydrogenase (NAD+) catalytic subunit